MNKDSQMLVYISLMALVFSCVVLGYSLIFFGFGHQSHVPVIIISPSVIIVAGLVIAAINGIASGILADQLGKIIEFVSSPILKLGIPLAVFLMTLAISILIALMSI